MDSVVRRGRLATAAEAPADGERFTTLHEGGTVRIEEIVSSARPEPVVYDQAHDEWVVLLDGSATVEVEERAIDLEPGEWLVLPAHVRHRVARVAPGSRWLAVHLLSPAPPAGGPSPAGR